MEELKQKPQESYQTSILDTLFSESSQIEEKTRASKGDADSSPAVTNVAYNSQSQTDEEIESRSAANRTSVNTSAQTVTLSQHSEAKECKSIASSTPAAVSIATDLQSQCGKAKERQSTANNPTHITAIEICRIQPNPNQPRKVFSETSILKLADSIRQFGIIQPLTVRKSGQLYELVAGERRLRAAKELGWKCVPCIIANITEEKSAQISIIENLLREDLNIFEQALAIETLIDTYSLTQEQIAEKLSSSQSYIANKLRLLRFSPEEREIILANQLTERHARALLRINDPVSRKSYLAKVIKLQLNVTNTEILVGEYLAGQDKTSVIDAPHHPKKTVLSFYNTIKRAIEEAKASNLGVKFQKFVGESYTEIVIKLPNSQINTNILEETDSKTKLTQQ